MVDATIPNKQGRTLTFLDLGGWTGNNYSRRKTGASDQMLHRGLGFGQIHWNINCPIPNMGTAVAQWLRCCATNRKVAGSIPVDVIGIFH